MSQVEQNKDAIQANRQKINKIDTVVMNNKASIYQSRSMIEENRLMILSNYAAAFMGNRQLANHNTDEIFENRKAILESFDAQSDVEANYIQASINKAALDFLAHRSALNSAVLDISEEMAEINTQLIAINKKIMDANQGIVEFNDANIEMNTSLLDGDLNPAQATPESNAELIAANSAAMEGLMANASNNAARIGDILEKSSENAAGLMENKAQINERRSSIMAHRDRILANRERISG